MRGTMVPWHRPWLTSVPGATAFLIALLTIDSPSPFIQPEEDSPPVSRSGAAATRGAARAAAAEPADDPGTRWLRDCEFRYSQVNDYVCEYIKQETKDGELLPRAVMTMKCRARPFSVYLKWRHPCAGQEVIYVAGRNDGKMLVHRTGLARLLTGTMRLDPDSSLARRQSKHRITEAGIGNLIGRLLRMIQRPTAAGRTVRVVAGRAAGRPCVRLEILYRGRLGAGHPYSRIVVFIDRELRLPIRLAAFGWPDRPGTDGPLVEDHTYRNLTLNVGLGDLDFRAENPAYGFGRF